ncbi:MAG: TIR domain-containing protein [Lachnospiraceae bacterium]|nr:TIR domain-containing protein [Lachnospiraceae bacterium]
MRTAAFVPYEGTIPYIFISYAHKNSDEVMPILNRMYEKGYRIWYDDGIAPGSEWPEYIAEHLNRCSVFMAFVSPESIDSSNCRREVTYALSKQKPFLGVMLKPTAMSPGMELQLAAQQCILRHNFTAEEAFLEKILSAEILQDCLGKAPVKAEAAGAKSTEAGKESAAVSEAASNPAAPPAAISDEDMAAVETMKNAGKAGRGHREKTPSCTEETQPAAKKKKKILPIILAAVLALIVLAVVLPGLKRRQVKLTDKISAAANCTFVILNDAEITNDVLDRINTLSDLRSLSFRNCRFEGADLSTLKRLDRFHTLEITGGTGLSDFSFLSSMSALTTLTVSGSGMEGTGDLSGLDKLTVIDLSDNSSLHDLSGLPLAQLKELNISGTAVSDLSPLTVSENLQVLDASYTPVSEASPLDGLKNLAKLNLSNTQISAFPDVFQSLAISELNLSDLAIDTVSAFDNLTVLKALDLSGTKVSDAACVKKSAETLKSLSLADCPVSDTLLADVSGCTRIEVLDVSRIPLDNLALAEKMENLTVLRAEGCMLTTLRGVGGKEKLREVYLADNSLSEVTDLYSLCDGAVADLRSNKLSSLEGLYAGKYTFLALYGNPIDPNTIPAAEGTEFRGLALDYSEELLNSGFVQKKLAKYLYVLDCPADQKLKLKDQIGYGLSFATKDYLDSLIAEFGADPYQWENYGIEE